MRDSGRKGSALLIVLGMFSFMLVSAVAFSVYMRASRAPSSYVRRNTAARQLVKAALARAIDEVDTAIGNDPFPGVGYNHDYGNNGITQGNARKNDNWHGRVFTPSNEVSMADTVSTLTLEALGYLPACLVNEARYWSRHTRTAKWHSLSYGLGQYAFTAVNVSDFFDINQLLKDSDGNRRPYLNRNSSPHGRISPTYLFRSGEKNNMNGGGAGASAFLSAIANGSGINNDPPLSQVPFVSLMDFNLSLGLNALGGFNSPFNNLIMNNNSSTFLSGLEEAARRQVFMAGGWNGVTNLTFAEQKTLDRVNLQYPEWQPFYGREWVTEKYAPTLQKCYDINTDFWLLLAQREKQLPLIAASLLCDYLDVDSVPLSLCLPSVESIPMLCGVTLNDNGVKYKTVYTIGPVEDLDANAGTKKRTDTCSFEVRFDGLEAVLTAVYPFLGAAEGFTAEAFARVFFVDEAATKDDGDLKDVGLRSGFFSLGDNFVWPTANSASAAFLQTKSSVADVGISEATGVDEGREKGRVKNLLAPFDDVSHTYVLARLNYIIDENGNETLDSVEDPGEFDFYNAGFERVSFQDAFKNGSTVKYRPSIAVWARIRDQDGKTVDMVPAVPSYDNLNGQVANKDVDFFPEATGGTAAAPTLRFYAKKSDAAAGVEPNPDYFKDPANNAMREVQLKQKVYMANDPRYNWAPEQWWAEAGGNPENDWFERVKAFRNGHDWCDKEIFMGSSDQGYLQSMYELLLIPQLSDCHVGGVANGPQWGDLEVNYSGYNGEIRTAANDVFHSGLMWRTYRSLAFNNGNTTWNWGLLDGIDGLPFDEPENGLRVNPYTDVTNIMFAAFANMPYDWFTAGTNWMNVADKDHMKPDSSDFKSTEDYIFRWSYEYDKVYAMSDFWMHVFRNGRERDNLYQSDQWMDAFDGFTGSTMDILNWRTGEVLFSQDGMDVSKVEGVLQDDMTLADRKFFYGFMKGCFANRSQLFLIFVRAEPAAGGGGAGSGARAVALVWRDPDAPLEGGNAANTGVGQDNAQMYLHAYGANNEESWHLRPRQHPPHRTRILFYHQFD